MTVAVSTLLQRVRDLVNEHHHWFDAVAGWYDHDLWTKRKFLEHLAARNQPIGKATLAVNDQTLNDAYRDRQTPEALAVWWVPGTLFKVGENHLYLRIDESSKTRIAIEGISVQHVAGLTEQTKRDHRPHPQPTAQAAVAVRLGLGYRPDYDRWNVEARERSVRIRVHFEGAAPVGFVAGVAVKLPTVGYSLLLDDLWDLVTDTIKDKMKDLLKDYFRKLAENDPRAQLIEQQVRDLESYLELHDKHMARMLPLRDDVTLAQVIEQARKPVTTTTTKAPPRGDKPSTPKAPARMHWFARLFLGVMALGVIAAAGLFTAGYLGMFGADPLARLADLTKKPVRAQGGAQPGDPKRALIDQLAAKKAKTGDVQVSLLWNNKNDLDLEVVAPSGEKVDLANRTSTSGGRFDIDMNIAYDSAVVNPVENVFFPMGQAPKGRYKVYVVHYRNHGKPDCQDPTRYTVRVLTHGNEQWAQGEIVFEPTRRPVLVHEFEVR